MNLADRLSQRARAIEFSGIRRAFEQAGKMKDPIDLSIGQPDYDAPDAVKRAACDAIQRGDNRYTLSAGLPALRAALRDKLRAEWGWEPGVLVTAGVSGGLTLALLALIDPGDEVILIDPYFVSYKQLVRMFGGVPVPVSSYPNFAFPAAAVEAAITSRTRALLVNSPGNPTGRVLSEAEVRVAADLCRRHDLALISDEIYSDLSFDGPSLSPALFAPDHTVVLRGFGKTYGVTGWRLGYLAAAGSLADELIRLQQYTFVCAPSMAQHAMLTALRTDVSQHGRDYARKRDLVCEALGGAFELTRPGGGFYVFPRAPARFGTAGAFVSAAAERGVVIIPGGVFSEQDTHFRISFATSNPMLQEGCRRLCELARSGPP
ncbi:MAG: pyridoxal phosphate-dependent aminotransferase [Phycisphaerae bacterium]